MPKYRVDDPKGYTFADKKLNQEYWDYLVKRNKQIYELGRQGISWGTITKQVGLSKDYIRELCHKVGIYH